jgi:hypothetical protein
MHRNVTGLAASEDVAYLLGVWIFHRHFIVWREVWPELTFTGRVSAHFTGSAMNVLVVGASGDLDVLPQRLERSQTFAMIGVEVVLAYLFVCFGAAVPARLDSSLLRRRVFGCFLITGN